MFSHKQNKLDGRREKFYAAVRLENVLRQLPPLNYLQAFEAAARHLSFTMAAHELNCTQASISQRVRGLERYFGRPLFLRSPSGVQLTEAGAAYLPGIGEALDQLSSMTSALAGKRKENTVAISAPISFAALWLAPRIRAFSEAFPEVDVRINCTIWNDPNSGSSDLQIQLSDIRESHERTYRLTHELALAVCSPRLTEGDHALRDPADLHHHRLIRVLGKYDYWPLLVAATGAKGLETSARIEADNAITALEIAAQGNGVALSLESFVSPYIEKGSLVAPFSERLDLHLGHHALVSQTKPLSRSAANFLDWLIAIARP